MFILVFVNLLIKPIYIFGIDKNVQLTLGAQSFGAYAAFLNITIVFNMLLDMGITSYNTRIMAFDKNEAVGLRHLASVKLLLFLFYTIIVIIAASLMNYSLEEQYLLWLLVAVQGANSFLQLIRSYYSGQQHFKWDAIISVADKFILIPVMACYLLLPSWRQTFTIATYALMQLLAYGIVVIITIIIGQYQKIFKKNEATFNIKEIVKNALPIAIVIFLMAIYMRCDMFILERLHPNGRVETNVYSFCYRWLDALNMLGFLIAGMLLSLFAKYRNDLDVTNQIVQLTSQFLIPAAIAGSVWCCFYAQEILQFLGMADDYTVLIFRLVIASFPGLCLIHIFSTMLTSHEHYKQLITLCIAGALASIIGNLLFVKEYGAMACAIVSLIVNIGLGGAYLLTCMHNQHMPGLRKKMFQFLGLIFVFIGINYAISGFCHSILALFINGIALFALYYSTKLQAIKQYLST